MGIPSGNGLSGNPQWERAKWESPVGMGLSGTHICEKVHGDEKVCALCAHLRELHPEAAPSDGRPAARIPMSTSCAHQMHVRARVRTHALMRPLRQRPEDNNGSFARGGIYK